MSDAKGDDGAPSDNDLVRNRTLTSRARPKGGAGFLRTAIEAIGEAIIVTGPELDLPGPHILYVNPAFCRMTGYTSEEVLGQTPRILQGPNTDRALLADLRRALLAGQTFQGEAVNYRKDGTEYAVEWLITPVLDGDHIIQWVAAQRDLTERRHAEDQKKQLAAEVNHRVNNTLATVESVAAQTVRAAVTAHEFKGMFQKRLRALVQVHRLLSRRQWDGVQMRELAEVQLRAIAGGASNRFRIGQTEVSLRPSAAVALGMALHELAINAAAHGALSVPDGRVDVHWTVEADANGNRLRLRWEETGGPVLRGRPSHTGFGSRLVESGLPQELQAKVKLLFEPSGLRCEIDAPLEAMAGHPP